MTKKADVVAPCGAVTVALRRSDSASRRRFTSDPRANTQRSWLSGGRAARAVTGWLIGARRSEALAPPA